jgi:hypothetical protein
MVIRLSELKELVLKLLLVIIIKAHHLLEKHTLGKWQQYWKEQLGTGTE